MKILIADDHPMVRDALKRTLLLVQPEADIVEAADFASAQHQLQRQAVQLALLDLHMPGMERVDGLRRLRLQFPGVPMVVASGEDDPAVIRATLAAGAVGFLPKSESPRCCSRRCASCWAAAPTCRRWRWPTCATARRRRAPTPVA